MKKMLIIIISFISFINIVNAQDLAVNSKSAILIEKSTGEVLYEKNSKEKLSPASMTKIASMLLIMEAIDEGKLSYEDTVTISSDAASMGGSQIFLEEGDVYKVNELLKGVAIASGNDAVYALAEKVGGTKDNFVKMMNEKCESLGCESTNFMNPHGLDEDNHYSSAYDMALLAKELLNYEDILEYTSIYEEYLNKPDGSSTWLVNTNKLIRYYPGVDGLKTGYTTLAGYCLTATAQKNDLRLIAVSMGASSSENRSTDIINMLQYGFNSYKLFVIKDKDESIGKIDVIGGKVDEVEVYLKEDATKLQKVTENNLEYTFDITINSIKAPLKENEVIGKVDIIDSDNNKVDTLDIIVKEEIKKANLIDYIIKNINAIINGK